MCDPNELKKVIESFQSTIPETVEIVLQHLEDEDKDVWIQSLQNQHVSIATMENNVNGMVECLKKTSDFFENSKSELENVRKVYNDLYKERNNMEDVQNKSADEFKNILKQCKMKVNEQGDLSLVVSQCTTSIIDPISKKQMTSPVKNTKCGHTYDKDTISKIINNRKVAGYETRCPYQGCVNKSVTMKDLVPDEDVIRELERLQNK